ncbi:MAG: glycosyltransferase family 4 protein [Rhodoferax sp.]|nr:glycosyltransferase family 4 protein [Rhodoferax sp.]
MRVAVLSYPMLFQTSGGLKMKVGRTVDALNRRGIEARLVDPVRERLSDFDLVHLFAPYNGNHRIVEQAKADGLPVLISTILNPPFTRWEGARARLLTRMVGRLTNWSIKTSYEQMVTGLHLADRLVVLGGIEKRMLVEGYLVPADNVIVVHNGIGAEFFSGTPDAFLQRWPIRRPFVLHTGLIGEVKNQLGLVRALKGVDVDIVLIGYAGAAARTYLDQCLSEGGSRVHYLGELPHGEIIASACAAAAVMAIPSEHEGMPNSILEALASDKPVVLTNNHTMDFSLPDDVASEVAPADHAAIRASVLRFLQHPPAAGRARSVVAAMSWDAVAAELEALYRDLLPAHASAAASKVVTPFT